LLSQLDEIHISVLTVALGAPMENKNWHDRVITLDQTAPSDAGVASALSIPSALPKYSLLALRMASVQLVSSGLLKDVGVGRGLGTAAMVVLAPSDLADWFARWIGQSSP
jgi:hypothetical protein